MRGQLNSSGALPLVQMHPLEAPYQPKNFTPERPFCNRRDASGVKEEALRTECKELLSLFLVGLQGLSQLRDRLVDLLDGVGAVPVKIVSGVLLQRLFGILQLPDRFTNLRMALSSLSLGLSCRGILPTGSLSAGSLSPTTLLLGRHRNRKYQREHEHDRSKRTDDFVPHFQFLLVRCAARTAVI